MVLGRCGAPGRSGAPVLYAHSRQLGRLAQLPKGNNWTLRRPEKLDRVSHSFEQETGATPATSYQLTKGITKQSGLIRKNKSPKVPCSLVFEGTIEFYRGYYCHDAVDQDPARLIGGGISRCGNRA